MDGERFDTVVKRLTANDSRRGALRLLGGGVLSLVFGRVGLRGGAAQDIRPQTCTPPGVRCGPNTPRDCLTCCSQCTAQQ